MELIDIWNLILYNFYGFIIVIARISGIFTFNPIFSRANVPNRVKAAMTLVLSVMVLAMMGSNTGYVPLSLVDFIFTLLKEALIGLVLGFFTNLIMTVFIYAGEMIDNQIGLAMAKAMDPSTGIQMPVFANVYYYIFILYFFLTGGHLSYIKLFATSYDILPIGFDFGARTVDLTYTIVEYFGTVLTLAVKFALPIIAVELIVEFSIGVMMKAVPTIQVFVINFQLKILVGLVMLIACAAPMSTYIDDLMNILFSNLASAVSMMGA